ncbi:MULTISPECIES: sugar kinase [unclassified Microbacterium]|uniref:sugar kinase n=1 Tax=unclassified Microbacterium TaxID=2609290 RepID=UPI000A9556A4|nr:MULTISPECIES: sugar kinase [unclassified Microbacterium]
MTILLTAGETMAMVAPVAAEPVDDAELFRIDAGGAESNVAAHAAALGVPARWFSRVGADPLGRRVLARIGARGVDVSAVIVDGGHRTGLYVKDPGRGVHYYRDDSAASHLAATDADAVDLRGVGIVHVSGISAALGGTAPEFLERLIARAHEAGVPVSFDVNHRAALWSAADAASVLLDLARRADLVFVGRDEAETLWGAATPAAIRELLPGVAELVVKDGDVGATAFAGTASAFVPAHRVDLVEAVGAGDAFAGGYLAARLAGADLAARLQRGHDRAALTLTTTADYPDSPPSSSESERA